MLAADRINDDDRQFILDNWQEGAHHINGNAGAFFTPSDLALDAALFSGCNYGGELRVLDLCAGIGALGLAAWWRTGKQAQVTCLEINPDYVATGRKLFPEARWIEADVNALPAEIARGGFDVVLANPPFGSRAKIKGPRFSGEDALAVVDIASDLARLGGFIMPQGSLPFVFSGSQCYQQRQCEKYDRFHRLTGVELYCESIDCSYYADGWKGVKPAVEMVSADFTDLCAARSAARQVDGLPLFQLAA